MFSFPFQFQELEDHADPPDPQPAQPVGGDSGFDTEDNLWVGVGVGIEVGFEMKVRLEDLERKPFYALHSAQEPRLTEADWKALLARVEALVAAYKAESEAKELEAPCPRATR